MLLMRRLAAFAAVIGALAVGAPVSSASAPTVAPTISINDPDMGSPSCPEWYTGPINLATGCPWWMMS